MSTKKRRKLAHEIMGDIGISLLISLFIFCFLYFMSSSIAERYMEFSGRTLTDGQQYVLSVWIMSVCVTACAVAFVVLFLFMSGRRTSYLTEIIKSIESLRHPGERINISVEGNDELSELAESINYMSSMQADMLEMEKQMREQREQFVRNLSHDIRTPLTSMISYSQMLAEKEAISKEDIGKYAEMMLRRSMQIKELTDRLLDEGGGKVERIDSVRFLAEQLLAEWSEMLEERFSCECAVTGEGDFAAAVDIHAMRRIFDNLASNVSKYADPAEAVHISAQLESGAGGKAGRMTIRQENHIGRDLPAAESRGIGLDSIRRIAAMHGGDAETIEENGIFSIDISVYFDRIESL